MWGMKIACYNITRLTSRLGYTSWAVHLPFRWQNLCLESLACRKRRLTSSPVMPLSVFILAFSMATNHASVGHNSWRTAPYIMCVCTHNAKIANFPPTVSPTSFTFTISFLRQTVGLEFYFHPIVALLEYSVVRVICKCVNAPIIPIERNVKYPSQALECTPAVTSRFIIEIAYLAP